MSDYIDRQFPAMDLKAFAAKFEISVIRARAAKESFSDFLEDNLIVYADIEIKRLEQELEEANRKLGIKMGLGSGDGNLFVYGYHDSIKYCQSKLLELEALRNTPSAREVALKAVVDWVDNLISHLEKERDEVDVCKGEVNGQIAVLKYHYAIEKAEYAEILKGK